MLDLSMEARCQAEEHRSRHGASPECQKSMHRSAPAFDSQATNLIEVYVGLAISSWV